MHLDNQDTDDTLQDNDDDRTAFLLFLIQEELDKQADDNMACILHTMQASWPLLYAPRFFPCRIS